MPYVREWRREGADSRETNDCRGVQVEGIEGNRRELEDIGMRVHGSINHNQLQIAVIES